MAIVLYPVLLVSVETVDLHLAVRAFHVCALTFIVYMLEEIFRRALCERFAVKGTLLDFDADAILLVNLPVSVGEAVLAFVAVELKLIQDLRGQPLRSHRCKFLATFWAGRIGCEPFVDAVCAKVSFASDTTSIRAANGILLNDVAANNALEFVSLLAVALMGILRVQLGEAA